MRKLHTIQTQAKLNNVYAVDETGVGGANHLYMITDLLNTDTLASIRFQTGARKNPESISGVLEADLLEIVRDRLKAFQAGEFACEYNARALKAVEEALYQMNLRVEDRLSRGVMGQEKK